MNLSNITIPGKKLREARLAAFPEATAASIALSLGVSRQALNDYESDRSQPSADVLIKMALLYQVDLRELATVPAKAKNFLRNLYAAA
jgi:transcriptional regulator with XRE-family HTH domain